MNVCILSSLFRPHPMVSQLINLFLISRCQFTYVHIALFHLSHNSFNLISFPFIYHCHFLLHLILCYLSQIFFFTSIILQN